jgi:MFS family permease
MMTAISLLYRYADFVRLLGGEELLLGWIIGVGMIGSLAMRLFQGQAIDHYGARRVWIMSSAAFVVACLMHLTVGTADGPAIFFWRIVLQTAIAGFFGASISFVSASNPAEHVAEVIGTLGTSGFLGIIAGTILGDALLGVSGRIELMFLVSAGISALACLFGHLATAHFAPPPPQSRPPLAGVLRRYHPGPVLVMGVATGFGLGLPTIFLRPYAVELGIPNLGAFFYPYMATALITRLAIRRLPSLLGIRPVVLIGLAHMVAAILLLAIVRREWHLYPPALLLGVAHACMFPSIVASGSVAFPHRYRGLATTLMLATFDVGSLIGQPTFGGLWDVATGLGWPGFRVAFVVSAVAIALAGCWYAWQTSGGPLPITEMDRADALLEAETAEIEAA